MSERIVERVLGEHAKARIINGGIEWVKLSDARAAIAALRRDTPTEAMVEKLRSKLRILSEALDHAERALAEHGDELALEQIEALLAKSLA